MQQTTLKYTYFNYLLKNWKLFFCVSLRYEIMFKLHLILVWKPKITSNISMKTKEKKPNFLCFTEI